MTWLYLALLYFVTSSKTGAEENFCTKEGECNKGMYSKEINDWSTKVNQQIKSALAKYTPCEKKHCSCHSAVIEQDLQPFSDGITKEQFAIAVAKGTKYQIIDGKLYRQKDCHFPARCAGVEHYLSALAPKMPNLEIALNTRDWPQVNHLWGHPKAPVFSFSKTKDYYDIMYPTWSFWEGGPAISLYPTGIGRWDKHRISISATAANKWPWDLKLDKAFFRGSRTSEERDALVLLSRSKPELVDAQYTKNQAWKSEADTLYAEPASEVSFEEHCRYKYLFNYRGVAASFRFKHLFLCKSLVFHVGEDWLEFFYPSLKPWVHYVPISPNASQLEIERYINFFKENDSLARDIAERGFEHIWEHLTDKDVQCYWRKLLKKYSKLVKYDVVKDSNLKRINAYHDDL
ncbi:O-glucosyltransferase rumi homolog [Ostrinia furnacalis]|uniref:O-glucosyltransferase rumi homolog n=1 Tax=Ostrinia furnacalis TaxID=93504 RepID=UPI001039E4EF|nr:O-glucosyltransferase rumi homolog [Ostrinia furnacalis]